MSPYLGIRIPEIISSSEFLFSNLFSKMKSVSPSVNYLLIIGPLEIQVSSQSTGGRGRSKVLS